MFPQGQHCKQKHGTSEINVQSISWTWAFWLTKIPAAQLQAGAKSTISYLNHHKKLSIIRTTLFWTIALDVVEWMDNVIPSSPAFRCVYITNSSWIRHAWRSFAGLHISMDYICTTHIARDPKCWYPKFLAYHNLQREHHRTHGFPIPDHFTAGNGKILEEWTRLDDHNSSNSGTCCIPESQGWFA